MTISKSQDEFVLFDIYRVLKTMAKTSFFQSVVFYREINHISLKLVISLRFSVSKSM